jgi:hypothetical protein
MCAVSDLISVDTRMVRVSPRHQIGNTEEDRTMAKIRNNLVIHGLSGMLGKQVVIRRQKNGQYVLCAAPGHRTQALSEAQKQHLQRFREAALYAKAAQGAPEYQAAADARGQSPYNVAIADFLHPPEIQHIDLGDYRGGPGHTIAVTAVDDVQVKTVGVLIATGDGILVEKGAAVPSANAPNQWLYTTTATAPSSAVKVVVDVADLAGQVVEQTEQPSAASV